MTDTRVTDANVTDDDATDANDASPPAWPGPTTAPSGDDGRPDASPERGRGVDRTTSGGAALHSEHGVTSISSQVVAKIAGLATQEIPGVHAMGTGLTRAIGSIRSKVPSSAGSASTQGVSVEVGQRQAAIDLDIVAYYGVSIVETADAIRDNVIDRLETMTGLEVVEVNISVDDLYIPEEYTNEGTRVG